MSGTVLDGRKIRDEILNELRPRIADLTAKKRAPALAVVLVGDDPASKIYVGSKIKACEEIGIRSVKITAPEDITTDELQGKLQPLAEDQSIDAILIQVPLPKQIDAEKIVSRVVDPMRDVDGFGPYALGQLVLNRPWVRACTPAGVMEIFKRYQIPIVGKKAVVVGRSDTVGKPMALLLLHGNATVTICHSRTPDLAAECRTADILVAATGRTAMLNAGHIKPGAVIVDIGINRVTDKEEAQRLLADDPARLALFEKNGSVLVGDVEPKAMRELSSAYTPVPGGVGPLTVAMLMVNTVKLAEHRLSQ